MQSLYYLNFIIHRYITLTLDTDDLLECPIYYESVTCFLIGMRVEPSQFYQNYLRRNTELFLTSE